MEKELVSLFKKSRWQVLLLVSLTIFLYARTLTHQYVWDDKTFANWNLTKDLRYLPWFFKGALPDTHIGDYRPLKGIILTLDHYFLRDNQIAYRAQAIVIHLIAVTLVYLLTKELTAKVDLAFFTSLLFAIHPVQVEAIAFFTSSTDIVGVLFFFLSFYFFVKWDKQKKPLYFFFSLFFWIVAILGYEMTLVLPLLLLVYKVTVGKVKTPPLRSRVFFELPYLAIGGIYLLVRVLLLQLTGNDTYLGNSQFLTFIASIKAIGKYIELLVAPVRLSVNHQLSPFVYAQKDVDYFPEYIQKQTVFDPEVVFASISIFILLFIAIKSYRKYPYYTFCIIWFFIAILPILNIIPLSTLLAERYLYMASFGFCLLVGMIIERLLNAPESLSIRMRERKWYKVGLVGIVLYLGFFSFRTWMRLGDWKNSVTLWSKELEIAPQSVLAHHNLGVGYMERGELTNAVPHFEYAATHNYAKIPKIDHSLGLAYRLSKQYAKAEIAFQQALSIDPENTSVLVDLGEMYIEQEKYIDAIDILQEAITSDQLAYPAHYALAHTFLKIGSRQEAINEFETVLKLNRLHMQAYVDLAAVYELEGNITKARESLDRGLIQDPQNTIITQQIRLLKNKESK